MAYINKTAKYKEPSNKHQTHINIKNPTKKTLTKYQKLQRPNKETPKKLATKHQNPSKNKEIKQYKTQPKNIKPLTKTSKTQEKEHKIGQPKNPRVKHLPAPCWRLANASQNGRQFLPRKTAAKC